MVDRAQVIGGFPHLSPQHPQQGLLLFGHAIRDRHRQLHPHVYRQRSQRDTGIARTGLDQLRVGKLATLHQAGQEMGGRPVLDGAEGVEPLELEEQLEVGRSNAVHPDERRRVVRPRQQVADVPIPAQLPVIG